MQIKPRNEYVIVKTWSWGWSSTEQKEVYVMQRRYAYEQKTFTRNYVATGLSYKQAKQMMKLFKEQ